MIKVHRINDSELVVNAELIEFIEAIPDTIITMTNGQKIMVKESPDDVIAMVRKYKMRILGERHDAPGNDV